MTPLLLSPMALVIEICFLFGVWLLYGALVMGVRPHAALDWARATVNPWLEREIAQAAALGWSTRSWALARVAGVAVGLGLGIAGGSPLTVLAGIVVGAAGPPYLLASRADRLRLVRDQALVEMVRTVTALVRGANQTLDQALVDLGQNPPPVLREALSALADTHRSVRERLIEVDRRLPSPIANRICLDLLIALHVTPEAFLDAAEQVLLPQYEEDLQIQRRNHAVGAGSRQSAFIVLFLMAVILFFVMSNQTLRAQYQSAIGQLVLMLVGAMVLAILWIIQLLTPTVAWVRWDLPRMNQLLERRHG